ncbi:MAG TPA: sensor domain-containing diguanylate cyclase [Polyangiaceae bacterium]|nr:sensor domain-containing diguanylate cyclase [Polyangiaceae bacterium]
MKTAELASAFDVSFQLRERDDGGLLQLSRCRELLHEIVHSDSVRRSELDALYRELGELANELGAARRVSGFRVNDEAVPSEPKGPNESATWRTLEPSLLPPSALDLPTDTRTALLALLDESPVPLLLARLGDGRICYANRCAGELFQIGTAALIERPLDDFLDDVRANASFWAELASKASSEGTLLAFIEPRSDKRFWTLTSARLITHDGERCAFLGLFDVTAQKVAERELRRNESNLRSLLGAAPIALLGLSPGTKEILLANERANALLGARDRPLIGQSFLNFVWDPKESAAFVRAVAERGPIEGLSLKLRSLAGKQRWVMLSAEWLEVDSDPIVLVGITDVTEQKELEQRLVELATHDGLTGLYNRRHFVDLAERELSRAARSRCPVSLCMLDADQFKQMNDEFGHAVGDRALTTLARATRGMLRAQDIFGRLGGEEFGVLLPDTRIEGALAVAERVRRSVQMTQVPTAHSAPVWITVSIGVAQHRPGESFETLMRRADHALYRAKDRGRNRVERED